MVSGHAALLNRDESAPPRRDSYRIDAVRSLVAFTVQHALGRVRGTFTGVSGTVNYDPRRADATSASVLIETASVMTHHDLRDTRLRSAPFLDVRSFPHITFTSSAVRRVGRRLELDGELSLRGVTRLVTVSVYGIRSHSGHGARGMGISARARAQLNRSDFGVGPNSAHELGGFLIGNEVQVELELELEPESTASRRLAESTPAPQPETDTTTR